MDVKSISVLGAGIMGSGIAHVSALGGFRTKLYDISQEILNRALQQIQNNLQKGVDLNKLTREQMESALANLILCADFDRAAESDFIIEAEIGRAHV